MANMIVRLSVGILSRIILIGSFLPVKFFFLAVVLVATVFYLDISVGHTYIAFRVVNLPPYLLPSRNWRQRQIQGGYRFLGLVVRLWLVTAGLGLMFIHWGRTASSPGMAFALGLSWCENTLCFNGLVSGQTPRTPKRTTNPEATTDAHLTQSLVAAGILFQTIEISLPGSAQVTVGDIVDLYGTPCRVTIHLLRQPKTVVLHYPHLQVLSKLETDRLSPDLPVHHLIMHSSSSRISIPLQAQLCRQHQVDSTGATVWRPWFGFTSLKYYLTAPFPDLR